MTATISYSSAGITSAAGVISLLDEPQIELKIFALNKLNLIVHEFWAEISDVVDKIEILYEDESFEEQELSALVASKVYYHLGAYDEALHYALGAASLLDVNQSSEYVDTVVARAIDQYITQRIKLCDDGNDITIDSRLELIVEKMFQRCFDDGKYKQAVGIALETRRYDMLESAIMKSDDIPSLLSYALGIAMTLLQKRTVRNTVLQVLVRLYTNLSEPDYTNMCQCYIYLNEPQTVVNILNKLVSGSEDELLMVFQICFDVYESATQHFIDEVMEGLGIKQKKEEGTAMEVESSEPVKPSEEPVKTVAQDSAIDKKRAQVGSILSGEIPITLKSQFLIRKNSSDMLVLKNCKDASRNAVCHTATVIANSLMHAGTTCDAFLRDNLDWLAKATNWAKFTATASIGVIHHGHETNALKLMSSYLPKEPASGSPYQEGGALYALGMIHANHGAAIIPYLSEQLQTATNETVKHGGCLGLGLAAMTSKSSDIYEQLKNNLYQDDAIIGEAAGISMGLVMMGSLDEDALSDMVQYAHETQHEKILRGLSLGIAMICYGQLEAADPTIQSLTDDKDPVLRMCGMYSVGMAYAGTGNNKAIRRLLHVAVSDVNDDVRRAAVISIGFLLFNAPEQCPNVVSLLSESYNSHVRYGAALALGISCAGSGMKEALSILEPMINDPVNYVRQGALLASAMVLVQQNDHMCPKLKTFKDLFTKTMSDKHEDVMVKFGAILAQGIINAGGRNCTISMRTQYGHTNVPSVVGLLVFTHTWFWFPLAHFLCLAFQPTYLIGLNKDLKMPVMKFKSCAKPSAYAYPPLLEPPKEKEKEKVSTAILSTTAKKAAKSKTAAATPMEVDPPATAAAEKKEEKKVEEKKDEKKEEKKEKGDDEKKEKKEEAKCELIANPARVLVEQRNVMDIESSSRYSSVWNRNGLGGFIVLRDTKGGVEEDIIETLQPTAAAEETTTEEKEPSPPEPFEYTE
ncbi:26S proteasome non-ATPase regulatory subunit 1-like [Bolinopsis microptera]|uniref:26S proteasome non-ATPase regulatory subunit 1-like n=1 Tax=Bolinopsis microptera TaxID=2820187 RepID=UPI00307B08E3